LSCIVSDYLPCRFIWGDSKKFERNIVPGQKVPGFIIYRFKLFLGLATLEKPARFFPVKNQQGNTLFYFAGSVVLPG